MAHGTLLRLCGKLQARVARIPNICAGIWRLPGARQAVVWNSLTRSLDRALPSGVKRTMQQPSVVKCACGGMTEGYRHGRGTCRDPSSPPRRLRTCMSTPCLHRQWPQRLTVKSYFPSCGILHDGKFHVDASITTPRTWILERMKLCYSLVALPSSLG